MQASTNSKVGESKASMSEANKQAWTKEKQWKHMRGEGLNSVLTTNFFAYVTSHCLLVSNSF